MLAKLPAIGGRGLLAGSTNESIEPDPNDSGTMGKQRQEGGADEFTIAYAGAVQAAR